MMPCLVEHYVTTTNQNGAMSAPTSCCVRPAVVRLFRKGGDGRRGIDHRLLVVCNEATARPIKIKDQKYDSGDQDSHDIDRGAGAGCVEPARVTCKSTSDSGNAKKGQLHNVRDSVAKCRQTLSLVVDHFVQGLYEKPL